jgi:tRNA A37 methylthiotransferase MiaB
MKKNFMAEEKKEDQYLNVNVQSSDNEILFRIKRTTPVSMVDGSSEN